MARRDSTDPISEADKFEEDLIRGLNRAGALFRYLTFLAWVAVIGTIIVAFIRGFRDFLPFLVFGYALFLAIAFWVIGLLLRGVGLALVILRDMDERQRRRP